MVPALFFSIRQYGHIHHEHQGEAMKPKICPKDCVNCVYWWPMPDGCNGRCHCIYSNEWSKWTKATTTCTQHSDTIDRTLDDREDVACETKR